MVLSIITVCLNEQQRIKYTAESIINQSYNKFEWIVIDGGSTDSTLSILEKYESHIDLLVSESDNGIYDAMNKGVELSNGEYLLFLNGGDYFYSDNVISKVWESLNGYNDIVYGHIKYFKKDGGHYTWLAPLHVGKTFFFSDTLRHSSSFFHSRLFKDPPRLYQTTYSIAADVEFYLYCQIKIGAKFKLNDQVISIFNLDGVSVNRPDITKSQVDLIRQSYYKWYSYMWYVCYDFGFAQFSVLWFYLSHPSYVLGTIRNCFCGFMRRRFDQ